MEIPITRVKINWGATEILKRTKNNAPKSDPRRKNRALNPKIDKRNTTQNYIISIETP
jgi:hypothetical protein